MVFSFCFSYSVIADSDDTFEIIINPEGGGDDGVGEDEDEVGGGGDLQGDDADGDGLTDDEEEKYGTNPYDIDSDNDEWSDYEEIKYGSDPLDPNDYPGKVERTSLVLPFLFTCVMLILFLVFYQCNKKI